MLARPRLTTMSRAGAGVILLLLCSTACRHSRPTASKPTPAPPVEEVRVRKQKITYPDNHDKEIKEILSLARQEHWEEAKVRAEAMHQKDPKNVIVTRVQSWVEQQAQQRREQAVEDKIREID